MNLGGVPASLGSSYAGGLKPEDSDGVTTVRRAMISTLLAPIVLVLGNGGLPDFS